MPKPSMSSDALEVAFEAVRDELLPRIESLRPKWFTSLDFQKRTGLTKTVAEHKLADGRFESIECIVNGRKGRAFRLKQ